MHTGYNVLGITVEHTKKSEENLMNIKHSLILKTIYIDINSIAWNIILLLSQQYTYAIQTSWCVEQIRKLT